MSVHAPSVDDPSNWVEAEDQASGRPYWINKSTNETSWNPPQTVNTEGDGEEWEEVIDESTGRAYFVNGTSRRATWSRPEHQQLMVQERFFRYIDKRGQEQGPFPESKMQEWYGEGYFKNEVKCREETSAEWSTIGVFFAEEEEEEEEEAHDNQARPSQLGNVEVVESKVVDLKQIVNALNAEIGGTQRMTQLAQQNANNNTTNTKRGNLYIREKGTFVTSFVERYFVLEGNKLSWYDDEAHVGNKVRGALVLNQASKAAVYSDADEDAFKGFRVTGEGDDIILQAPRYMAMKAWINAVGKSVKELTGATHTEVLETMTEAALKQVVKLTNAQKQLEQIVTVHMKDMAEEDQKSSAASSPRINRTSSIDGTNETMVVILNKTTQIGQDLKEWSSASELNHNITEIKRLSRTTSTKDASLGKNIEGYLTKRAMSGKNSWKKRYFVLLPSGTKDTPFVTCKYMSKPGAKAKGVISLSGHTYVEKVNDVKGKEFVFEMHEGGETLCVQASTEKEREDWISAIQTCVDLFVKSNSESTSKTTDHFINLLKHMTMARSIVQRLLKLVEEYSEAEQEESVKRQVSFFFFFCWKRKYCQRVLSSVVECCRVLRMLRMCAFSSKTKLNMFVSFCFFFLFLSKKNKNDS